MIGANNLTSECIDRYQFDVMSHCLILTFGLQGVCHFGCNGNKLGFLQCCVLYKGFSSWKIYLDIYAFSANHKITSRVCTFAFFSGTLYHSECLHSLVKRENLIYLFATSSFPVFVSFVQGQD